MTDISIDTPHEELYPIALLMDELRHDDVGSRVEAMKRLKTIAIALGPQRSRDELIPFLEDVIPEDEDEVIAIAAEELGSFLPLLGGETYANLLIPILEKISGCEEPIVREKSIDSLCQIAQDVSNEHILEWFVPLINRLSKERWFSLHIAAVGLFKSVLNRVDNEQLVNLLKLYFDLIVDDSPMVRKASGKELPILIDLLVENSLMTEEIYQIVIKMYENLINDNQDSIKFLSVDVLISILSYLKANNLTAEIEKNFQSLIKLINDPSWRVRYMISDRFEVLAEKFNNKDFILKLVPYIILLMKDNEAEVRKGISKKISKLSVIIEQYDNENKDIILKEILPIVNELSVDESENVRSSLALEITGLSPILGKELTIKFLLPIFIEMLKDEFSEVRLNIICNLQTVNQVIGIDLLNESLMPAITELAHDKLWRVRLAIIEQIPLLAKQLGNPFFDERLDKLCMEWLWDSVYSIREAGVKNLVKLCELFGEEWSKNEIIFKILSKKEESIIEGNSNEDYHNFICRNTCLMLFDGLVDVLSVETVEQFVYPFILELSSDKVANIRFNTAKSLNKVGKKLASKDDVVLNIKERLQEMLQDDDVDVRYFAQQSLNDL